MTQVILSPEASQILHLLRPLGLPDGFLQVRTTTFTPVFHMNQKNLNMAFNWGAWSCLILLAYSLITIVIVATIGGPPSGASETFSVLRDKRVLGLLRLDILTVFVMPLYFILFYALYLSLRTNFEYLVSISFLLVISGVILFLSAPSVFSYLRLSDAYTAVVTEEEKNRLLAAAEALFATDIWNGTGPRIGGLLVQTGAVMLSIVMLRTEFFSKATAITGILTHGLDLLHMVLGFFYLSAANSIMAVAGILYLVWFPLVARDLFRLKNKQTSYSTENLKK